MSTNSGNKDIIQQTAPDLSGKGRVDLVKSDFDAAVWAKGYRVHIDRALMCPCRNNSNTSGLPSCKNCGGVGWVFINRYESRVLLQAMNLDTSYKDWTEDKRGQAKVTMLDETQLALMDRITVLESEVVTHQVLYPLDANIDVQHSAAKTIKAKTVYDVVEVVEAFLFQATDTKLIKLVQGVDFDIDTIQPNLITFDTKYNNWKNFTVSLRYKHHPAFHIIDLVRETMSSVSLDKSTGSDQAVQFPVHAIARRAQYVLDEQNYKNSYLLDNSYEKACSTTSSLPLTPTHLAILNVSDVSITIGWEDVSDSEDNYIIQRAGLDGIFTQIVAVAADVVQYINTGLSPETYYFYRIATFENGKQSPWTNIVGAKTLVSGGGGGSGGTVNLYFGTQLISSTPSLDLDAEIVNIFW